MRSYSHVKEIRSADLIQLARDVAGGKRLLVASNRGPIQYVLDREGGVRPQRGAGGVVTALSALKQYISVTWVAAAMGEGDRKAIQQHGERIKPDDDSLAIRFITVPPNTFQKYYDVFSNPLLWFLQHYMWDPAYLPNIDRSIYEAWEQGYVPTNRAFAQAIVEEMRRDDCGFAMLHDYHLYLAAREVRQTLPSAVLQHFIHIPWPDPSYWTLLPSHMRRAIFQSLCANDILGFQTRRFAENFLQGCHVFLPDAQVDLAEMSVTYEGHRALVKEYPISIDVEGIKRTMRSTQVHRYVEKLRSYCGEKTIVRVDRMEPSKNIIRGFKAFDLLLRRHKEYRGKVKMLAFLVPSRTSLREYKHYTHEVLREIEEVNLRHGSLSWKPIELFYENNYAQALAGMSLADVLLVNPIIDGMNLVSKEGPTVNQRNCVLVLSEGAGSFEQLHGGALAVAASDIEGTVRVLHRALTMPEGERAEMAEYLRSAVEEEDLGRWLYWQLEDLARLLGRRGIGSRLASA